MRVFLLPLTIIIFAYSTASSQGLFEQSLSNSDSLRSETISFNGFIRNTAYLGRSSETDNIYFQSIYSQFNLMANVNIRKYGSAFAEFQIRTGNEFNRKITEYALREAYGDVYLGPITIRAGKQILSWGSSSFINPSDQFSPINPSFRSPNLDDLRLGIWALNTNLALNAGSNLQILWIPDYLPSELLTDPFNFPEYIVFGKEQFPDVNLANGNFGLNYDARTRIFDLELSYYHGYRNTPSIIADSIMFNLLSLQPELIQLIKKPYRINSAGFSLTVPIGGYIVRTEAGWMNPEKDEAADYIFEEFSYSAEIEQSGENIALIGGYYGKYIEGFSEPEDAGTGILNPFPDVSSIFPSEIPNDPEMLNGFIEKQTGNFNRLYNYQMKEYYHSAFASVRLSVLHSIVDFEVPVIYNFTAEELTLMPSLRINISDGLYFQMGAYYLYGAENSLYEMAGRVLNAGYCLLQFTF